MENVSLGHPFLSTHFKLDFKEEHGPARAPRFHCMTQQGSPLWLLPLHICDTALNCMSRDGHTLTCHKGKAEIGKMHAAGFRYKDALPKQHFHGRRPLAWQFPSVSKYCMCFGALLRACVWLVALCQMASRSWSVLLG